MAAEAERPGVGGGGADSGILVPSGIDLAYDTAIVKLEEQAKAIDQFDSKTAPLIALLGLITAAYAAAARTPWERIGGGMLLGVTTACVMFAYFVRQYGDAPRADTLAAYAGYQPAEMKTIFLEAVLAALESNRQAIRRKALALKLALILIFTGAIGVIVIVAAGWDGRVQ